MARGMRVVETVLVDEVGHHMTLQVVHIDEGYIEASCKSFGEAHSYEEGAHQSGTAREGDSAQLFLGDAGTLQCLVDHGHHILLVGA